ncbi:probable membrane-associated kinase regulator 4 [Ziziphus jujuba]|uniref:Probable membrane-associated kinase regulator 4 n=1 Tax=Ziziphus jujuba TaxID=326968 RepID=A0A6P3ZDQ1_ZIZJJ|nr:probable membrane-associated kinase regulator 4 [Ziziphus jujuba]
MALDYLSPYDHAEDDYIDMEVSSFSTFLCHSRSSPHQNPREFEFQMSSTSLEREPTTSPADELFYKGKLLPLHLPPRLQMVEKLLQNTNISPNYDHIRKLDNNTTFEEFYSTPLATNTATTPTSSTPFESCNISPSESCRVSRELNPEEYMYEYNYSAELSSFIDDNNPKKSWTKKLKHSALGSKLKASRAYLKSWFGKSGCSNESSTAPVATNEGSLSKPTKDCSSKYLKGIEKNPLGQIQNEKYQTATSSSSVTRSFNKEKMNEDGVGRHRRSFSVSIKRHSTNKSSSSSSSSSSSGSSTSSSCSYNNNSLGVHELQFLKRCSSANSEIESPIQGAIAHCKESQQLFRSRKTVSEVGYLSFSSSRLGVCEDQERPDVCRG